MPFTAMNVCTLAVLLVASIVPSSAFLSLTGSITHQHPVAASSSFLISQRGNRDDDSRLMATKTTLTEETDWNLRFVMRGVPTQKGKRVDEIFSVRAQFLEEEGYEPPQGVLKQVEKQDDASRMKITKIRWQLSEDPNDRKDGLWVWGLFKEPLYPFLLLQLETDEIRLAAGTEDEDSIQPLQLYAQIIHKRDGDLGVVLEGADLKIRVQETVNADIFGVSKAELYEEESIGTLSIQAAPALKSASS